MLCGLCGAKYELTSTEDGSLPSPLNMGSPTAGGGGGAPIEVQPLKPAPPIQPRYFGVSPTSEQSQVFCLELLIRVLLFNRDRVGLLWPLVREHLVDILMVAKEPCFFVERVIIGLLRLALRLIRRQELTTQVSF